MTWIGAIIVVFGALMIGFSAFWARFRYRTRRSGVPIDSDVNALLGLRVWTFLAMGVCFVVAGVFHSRWFFFVAIGALLTKLLADEWLRRRVRQDGSSAQRPGR